MEKWFLLNIFLTPSQLTVLSLGCRDLRRGRILRAGAASDILVYSQYAIQ